MHTVASCRYLTTVCNCIFYSIIFNVKGKVQHPGWVLPFLDMLGTLYNDDPRFLSRNVHALTIPYTFTLP